MIKIESLSFAFGRRRLFHDLSVEVNAGELVHITGPNGVGKSTLMSIVAGLLSPQSGTITVYDSDGKEADDRREVMEYIPAESNGLFLKLDAVSNLQFWCALRGIGTSDEIIHPALKQWSLDHPLVRDSFPVEKYSTGMKRRLALARLSLSPAPLWLLDEPIYGLDAQAIEVFRGSLRQHLQDGGLGLIVSHDTHPLEGLVTGKMELGTP